MIINKESSTDLSGFYIVFKGSTYFETTKNFGISHFLEHLMCNKLRQYYNDFDRYSIDFNAYTSNTEIVFFMTGLDEYVNLFKYKFLDAILNFEISEDDFNNEKKIVLEEYSDSFQNHMECHFQNLMRVSHRHYSPIGEKSAIKKLTLADVMEYHSNFYGKPTSIINISKYNPFVADLDFNTWTLEKYETVNKPVKFEKSIEFDKVSIIGHSLVNDDFVNVKFLCAMLGGSLSAPLVEEIREKAGLAYGVSIMFEQISDNEGILFTNVITEPENKEAVFVIYERVLTNPDQYVTKERFDIVMEAFQIMEKKHHIFNHKYIDGIINPEMDVISNLSSITYDGIIDTFKKYIMFDKLTWSTFEDKLIIKE